MGCAHPQSTLEVPDGACIGQVAGVGHADEALPNAAIKQRVFGVFIGEVAIELLQNDDLDQHFGRVRGPSAFGLGGFTSSMRIDHLRQRRPIHQPAKRIQNFGELRDFLAPVVFCEQIMPLLFHLFPSRFRRDSTPSQSRGGGVRSSHLIAPIEDKHLLPHL